MQVGPAILIEFTAPAVVVVYLWLRYGQRPGRMTLAGAGLAALGLVLVLDLVSGADLSLPGVLWALAAMVGCATYFIISADEDNGLPPLVLAWGGLVVGALTLAVLALIGVLPMRASTASPTYADVQVAWWVPLVVLGLVTAALAYVAGIAAGRRLGSRLASFVALLEVVASVMWAWLLLHELPAAAQLLGGLLILAGVVAVKLGERSVVVRQPPGLSQAGATVRPVTVAVLPSSTPEPAAALVAYELVANAVAHGRPDGDGTIVDRRPFRRHPRVIARVPLAWQST